MHDLTRSIHELNQSSLVLKFEGEGLRGLEASLISGIDKFNYIEQNIQMLLQESSTFCSLTILFHRHSMGNPSVGQGSRCSTHKSRY